MTTPPTVRWGLRGTAWQQVRSVRDEETARSWAASFANDRKRPEPITIYRDEGDGWQPIETVSRPGQSEELPYPPVGQSEDGHPMTADPRLQLLDDLIAGVANLELDAPAIDVDGQRIHLHTTAQVEAWLREERRNLDADLAAKDVWESSRQR